MATPAYQGQGPATAANGGGFLGQIGSYFGAPAPVYASAPAAPVPVPVVAPDPKAGADVTITAQPAVICPIDPEALAAGQIVIVVPRGNGDGRIALDPDALASGQIAIVVPRGALMTP